jgi:hypothetical protein
VLHVPGVSTLSLLTLLTPLLWLTTATAWALASGRFTRSVWPFYRPVAWALSWLVVSDAARVAAQVFVLMPARASLGVPYTWPARAAFHAEIALAMSQPATLVAVGMVAFLRRPWWPVAVAWAALCIGLTLAYPELRAEPLGRVFAAWSWICVGLVALFAALTYRSVTWVASHIALLLLCGGEAVAAYGYLGHDPRSQWDPSRGAYATALVLLMCYQCLQIVRYRRT